MHHLCLCASLLRAIHKRVVSRWALDGLPAVTPVAELVEERLVTDASRGGGGWSGDYHSAATADKSQSRLSSGTPLGFVDEWTSRVFLYVVLCACSAGSRKPHRPPVCVRAFVLRYNHLDFEVQYRAEELTGADLMAVLEQGEEVPPTNATILGFKVTPRR